MSIHLSSKQISRWMAGEHNPEAERHLRDCAQCVAEITRLESLFEKFGSSVLNWSESQAGAETPELRVQPEIRSQWSGGMLRWKLIAAVLAMAFAVPLCINLGDRQPQNEAPDRDVQLLEEVNAQLSRSVPASLEPLMKLIAFESDAVDN